MYSEGKKWSPVYIGRVINKTVFLKKRKTNKKSFFLTYEKKKE